MLAVVVACTSDTDGDDATPGATTGTGSSSASASTTDDDGGPRATESGASSAETTTGGSDSSAVVDGSSGSSDTADDAVDSTDAPTGTGTGGLDDPCALDPPVGRDPQGFVIEPCTVVGEAIRGELLGVTVDLDGSLLVNVEDHPTRRYADDEAPDCTLHEVDASDLPPPDEFFGDWGPIEVLPDGTTYEMASWSGFLDFEWVGPSPGHCLQMDGFSTSHLVGFGPGGQMVSGALFDDHPLLFDFSTCVTTILTDIPVVTRAAMFYDEDIILVASNRLHRWTVDGVQVWENEDTVYFGNEVVRCGDDLCVAQAGIAALGHYAGVDGSLIAQRESSSLFGIDAPLDVLGRSPDEEEIVVAFQVEHPDAACADLENVVLYRMTGF